MEPKEQVDARKGTLQEQDALKLAEQVHEIYSAKGKRVVHLDCRKDPPDRQTLRQLLLGPTGNLRAPTLRIGKTLIVGFDQDTYQQVFAQ